MREADAASHSLLAAHMGRHTVPSSTLSIAIIAAGAGVACREDPKPAPELLETSSRQLAPRDKAPGVAHETRLAPAVRRAEAVVASFRVDGVAADDVLNMRSRPDATSPLVGAIPPGVTNVEGLGMASSVGQSTWQRVRYAGAVGWVNARFLKANAQ